jgi:hypothetical protein
MCCPALTLPNLRSVAEEALTYAFTSFDVMSYVIMKPVVPLYSNGFGPTR